MPILVLNLTISKLLSNILTPSRVIFPLILHVSIKSFILLKHLNRVDFPHPDGPINAVTSLSLMSKFTLNKACFSL